MAGDRIRAAPRARHSEPGLCPDLAGDPVRARLPHADRAQHRAWHAARHLRAGDADDHLPQSADQMVAAGDLDLCDQGRVRARHLELTGRLLCRPSGMAVAVLAGRGDSAADGPDGLSRHAQRSGQSRPAARRRLGRHAAARRLGLDDLCRPRSGQSSGLAGVGHGDGAVARRRRAVPRLYDQRNAGSPALGACQCAVLAQCRALAGCHPAVHPDQPLQLVAGAEFPHRCWPDAAGTKRRAAPDLRRTADVVLVPILDLPAPAFRSALRGGPRVFGVRGRQSVGNAVDP